LNSYGTESGETDEQHQGQHQRQEQVKRHWKRIPIESSGFSGNGRIDSDGSTGLSGAVHAIQRALGHTPIVLVTLLMFLVFAGAGIAICLVVEDAKENELQEEALGLAIETGDWFSDQLDQAILPLFSMAQFATHLGIFRDLPDRIGVAGEAGSLPMINGTYHRNLTGVCDEPELISTFIEIATGVKKHAGMDGILVNIQLAPQGVICLLHPMNNSEDFEDGNFLDSTSAWGLDLLNDPVMSFIAVKSIKDEVVGIAGPRKLTQCPTCDRFFIARLPIVDDSHEMVVDGVSYPRWGFATALIAWTHLVERSGIYESFENRGFQFQLTRTDTTVNQETGELEEEVVILAETPDYHHHYLDQHFRPVSTTLETTNNQWMMTVVYDHTPVQQWTLVVCLVCVVVASFVAYLVYTVLLQKQIHSIMRADTQAQEAKVNTERNMTAYFAHELRNPLSALDSALRIMTDEDLPESTKELVDGMQLCSSFMSSIMNNLLDVRKIEEGKMEIRSRPVSLSSLVRDSHKMMKSSVRPGVQFFVDRKNLPKDKTWVLADEHRIQQVLTNVVTNAIKYTLEGSITLAVSWKDDLVQLECIDTGPGIPKSEQEKMFERFVQRGGAPGTGLGLNIAQQIVTMMKGTICFDSDPTVKPGTTCQILLPLKEVEQPSESLRLSVEVKPIEEPISILIMDDIKMNRVMLQRRIKKAVAPNATVVVVETGEKALELCKEQNFHIIICDQYMEEAGGVMVGTDVIIAMRRNKVDAFIIGCSGNDLDEAFFEAGADMVWGKPVPTNDEIIAQWRDVIWSGPRRV
jgi:signal transduction histidine kinase/CheY-like chemotaxis protein